jgi:hypothetical protein
MLGRIAIRTVEKDEHGRRGLCFFLFFGSLFFLPRLRLFLIYHFVSFFFFLDSLFLAWGGVFEG